jgi:tetratricopeptide (TPR) repeat protein
VQQRRLEEGVRHFQQALRLRPDYAEAHYHLGNTLREQGKLDEAVASYRRALELKPDFPHGHNSLGIALVRQANLPAAVASFREAVRLKPDFAHAHTNLGNALKEQGRLEEALPYYGEAVRLRPDLAEAHNNLGTALQEQGKMDEAMACYRRALQLKPDYTEAHCNLGHALQDQAKLDEAMACYRRALQLQPDHVAAHDNLGKALQQQERLEEAKACYRQALRYDPDQLLYELRIAAICPAVFHSSEEIDQYRRRLLDDLRRFSGMAFHIDLAKAATLACEPSFNWQFHGRNDRILKEAYAELFRKSFQEETPAARTGLPRIGFVVTRKHETLFLRSLRGVLERLDPKLFEVVVVCSTATCGMIRAGIRSDRIGVLAVPERLDQMLSTIREARFDLLYFWEIGTDTTNYFLPFFRLAPVQCTSWGIQVTSGIPQMDCYLSSALVEPEDAQSHYREKLVLANTLLSYQERVAPPQSLKTREDFGFRGDQHIYLCAQQLGKFHPDFDPLLAAILRQDARGVIVATEDRHGCLAAPLRRRFAATMPEVADRVVFL